MASVRSVAVLCDIHGNLPALDAVLAELAADPPDAVGDRRRRGRRARSRPRCSNGSTACRVPLHWLRGNADRCVVAAFDGEIPEAERDEPMWVADAWTAERLSTRAARPARTRCRRSRGSSVEGLGPVLFCHGTPRSDEERVTAVTPEPAAGADPRRRRGGARRRRAHRTASSTCARARRRMVNAGSRRASLRARAGRLLAPARARRRAPAHAVRHARPRSRRSARSAIPTPTGWSRRDDPGRGRRDVRGRRGRAARAGFAHRPLSPVRVAHAALAKATARTGAA